MTPEKSSTVSCHTVTPYLLVPDAAAFISFVKVAFDAINQGEAVRRPDGSVLHAEIVIGDSVIMIGEPQSPWQPTPCMLYVYLPDVDAIYKRAVAAGGQSVAEPTDMFWGDRYACIKDCAGNHWWIATRKSDLTMEEIQQGADQFYAERAKQK